MEWDQERMSASIEHAVEAARRMVRDQGSLDGMLTTLHPTNDSGFTAFGFGMPEKPEDRDLIADVIRGIADELDAIMVTLAVSAWIQMPGDLDSVDLEQIASVQSNRTEILMITASHRVLGDSSRFERIWRDGSSARFEAITAPPGLAMESRFERILSPQREPVSAVARKQAHEIATRVRMGRAGNDNGQLRH
ncbi:MAG TPA: hypothetical protein VFL97_04200 [Nitrococcus sp.]|nr:hypothetical protein [Nitrococcus sp.]